MTDVNELYRQYERRHQLGTQEIHIMVGIPGSGKSTKAKELAEALEADGHDTVIISRDEIRLSILEDDEPYFAQEEKVFHSFIDEINMAIQLGIEYVFIDATHINEASRKKLFRYLRFNPETKIVYDVMKTRLSTCLERNSHRVGRARVPNESIESMYQAFSVPKDNIIVIHKGV